jgi:hypothetical protein
MENQKDIVNILLKASGEGSRGGNIIGHTKSGKAIYGDASHVKHSDFSEEDHRDALKIREHLRVNSKSQAESKEHSRAEAVHERHAQNLRDYSETKHKPEPKDRNEHPTGFQKSQEVFDILKSLL